MQHLDGVKKLQENLRTRALINISVYLTRDVKFGRVGDRTLEELHAFNVNGSAFP